MAHPAPAARPVAPEPHEHEQTSDGQTRDGQVTGERPTSRVDDPPRAVADESVVVAQHIVEDKPFPLTTPFGSQASMFIQWKGTVVCLDFHCPCGTDGHFDGDFAHSLRCPACNTVYELGTQVIAKRTDDAHLVKYAKVLEQD